MIDDIEILRELSLAEQMGRAIRLWRTVVDRELLPLGLTHPRWSALWKLQRLNDNISQKTLANALEIELPSLMRTLNQLEEQGLIIRHCSETDKRVRIISLTAAGKSLMKKVEKGIMQIRQELLSGLAPAELSILEKAIQQISHNALDKLNKTDKE